jgi:hypothetical protein
MKKNVYALPRLLAAFSLCSLLPWQAAAAPAESWDNIPPVAICKDQLNISLTSAGNAVVYAHAFDGGSYDNQCLAAIEVRRMDQPNAAFAPYVVFYCSDIGAPVMVELQARDCAGNVNKCWSLANIEDKLPPVIHCPPNKTIACDQYLNLTLTGQATATDNCGVASITYTDVSNINSCGTGTILRTWKATDIYGMMATCTQTITLVDNTPIVVVFPPDYTTYDCTTAADLLPANLPPPYNEPQVLYRDCELIATSYTDWVFTAAPNSCLKIMRQWKVINWCTYEGGSQGLWQGNQLLVIKDTIPPTFTCPGDQVFAVGSNCRANITLPQLTDIDDCLESVTVRLVGQLGEGYTFNNVPLGEYEMTYIANDGCNNVSTCKIKVQVVDRTPPGVVCYSSLSVPLMEMDGDGMAELWAADVETGSSLDNCTPYDHLEFRLGRQPAPGQTSPPDEDFLAFDCSHVGPNVVAVWAGDESGNWSYCLSTIHIQDNRDICPTPGPPPQPQPQGLFIAGLVADEWDNCMMGVAVGIDTSATGPDQSMTDSLGRYWFDSLSIGMAYTLTPAYASNPLDGLDMDDFILLSHHITGVTSLSSPYQIIAADVNMDGQVDMADLVLLLHVHLGLAPGFADSVTWRFVPEAFDFPDPQDPFQTPFPERLVIDSLAGPLDSASFVAIKLGDLDGSASRQPGGIDGRSALAPLVLEAEDRALKAGEEVEVSFYGRQFEQFSGLGLWFRQEAVVLEDLEAGLLAGLRAHPMPDGRMLISWQGALGHTAGQGEAFRLRLRARRDGLLSELLALSPGSAAFRPEGPAEAVLDFKPAAAFRLLELFPNPASGGPVNIRFEMPQAGEVAISAWDSQGRMVYRSLQSIGDPGVHILPLDSQQLGGGGVYWIRLETPAGAAAAKLVLLP